VGEDRPSGRRAKRAPLLESFSKLPADLSRQGSSQEVTTDKQMEPDDSTKRREIYGEGGRR